MICKLKSSRTIYYIIDSFDSWTYIKPNWLKIESGWGRTHPKYKYFRTSQYIMKAKKALKTFLFLKKNNKADIDLTRVVLTKSTRKTKWCVYSDKHKLVCKKRKGRNK